MEWIKVSDKLPEESGWYLCTRMPEYLPNTEYFVKEKPYRWTDYSSISHWMPLPEKPKD